MTIQQIAIQLLQSFSVHFEHEIIAHCVHLTACTIVPPRLHTCTRGGACGAGVESWSHMQ